MTAKPIPHPYEDLMRHVHEHGVFKADRTGTGTRSVFGHQMRFDLNDGFPLVTTKKIHTRSVFEKVREVGTVGHKIKTFLAKDFANPPVNAFFT